MSSIMQHSCPQRKNNKINQNTHTHTGAIRTHLTVLPNQATQDKVYILTFFFVSFTLSQDLLCCWIHQLIEPAASVTLSLPGRHSIITALGIEMELCLTSTQTGGEPINCAVSLSFFRYQRNNRHPQRQMADLYLQIKYINLVMISVTFTQMKWRE